MAYSAGLRVSEVCQLQTRDIDLERMTIHIVNSKGGKDRMVPLSPALVGLLQAYFLEYQPTTWLFAAQLRHSFVRIRYGCTPYSGTFGPQRYQNHAKVHPRKPTNAAKSPQSI